MMKEKDGCIFNFGNYKFESFDEEGNIVDRLLPVDFVVETNTHLLFIELKNFDELKNKNNEETKKHLEIQIASDLEKLKIKKDKSNKDKVKVFRMEIGGKFKDSVLRKYIAGYSFNKPVKYIFIFQFYMYAQPEMEKLREDIFHGYIPTFKEIKNKNLKFENFEVMNIVKFSETYFPVILK